MVYNYGGSEASERIEKDQVPAGIHEFMIESQVEGISKSSGNPMITFSLKCMDAGKEDSYWGIRSYLVLDGEKTDQNIGNMMAAMGKDRGPECAVDFQEWVGEYLSAKVRHEKYEGDDQAKIHYFLDARATEEELKANPGVAVEDAIPSDNDIPF